MPIVEVEGQQFEFPDGTSDEVIGNAIRGHFAGQPEPANQQQEDTAGLKERFNQARRFMNTVDFKDRIV